MNTETNSGSTATTTGSTATSSTIKETNDATPTTLSAATGTTTALTGLSAALAKLSAFDHIIVLDASGSMDAPNKAGNATPNRWSYMQETALGFTKDICTIDADGIGICVFSGSGIDVADGCNVAAVQEIFKKRGPKGTTPLAEALTQVLEMAKKSSKKKTITIFTDGVPDDQEAVATLIRNQSNSQVNDDDLTFVFIQVGDDAGATKYLNDLDEHMSGIKFDIVSAYTIAEADKFATTAELLAHAIDN